MTTTMTAVAEQNYRNLQVIRGGGRSVSTIRGRRRGRRVKTAAEMVLERWVREEFNALTDADGKRPSEAIQKICEGVQTPLGCFGRRMVEAHAAGCTHAQVRQLWGRVGMWIDRLWDERATAAEHVTERVFFQEPRLVA